jgi:HK97 family phage portal protein
VAFGFGRPAPVAQTRSAPGSWAEYVVNGGVPTGVSESSTATVTGAMAHSVVFRAVTLISGTIASFPVHGKHGRTTIAPAPDLVRRPSPLTRRTVWVQTAVTSMLLAGGAYGLVDDTAMGSTGWPSAVDLIDPSRVDWTSRDGWTLDQKPIEEYPLGPLWQVPLHVLPGSPKGLNPLTFARRTIYAGLIAQEFGANFFKDGGHPTAVISPPVGSQDPGDKWATAIKAKIMAIVGGTKREPIILPGGVTWTQMQVNPDDSQFLDLMRFSGEEVCRFFGLDASLANVNTTGSTLTYTNISDRREDFKQFTLLLPMLRLEEAWSELLPGDIEVKMEPAGLLRASLADRYASYKTAAEINQMSGETFLSVDEMRELEDRESLAQQPVSNGGTP